MKMQLRRILWLACCLAMIISLFAPIGALAADTSASITGAKQTPYVKADGQESEITLTADREGTYYLLASAAANAPADGAKYPNDAGVTVAPVKTELTLKAGSQSVKARTPDTNELLGPGNTATLTLQLFSDAACEQSVSLPYTDANWARTRHWEFYLSQAMHTDLGYTAYQEDLRTSFSNYLDTVQQYTEKYKNAEQPYRYAIESGWMLGEGYMTKRNADQIGDVVARINQGEIGLGAGLFNYTMECFSTEENARAAYYTNRNLVDKLGIEPAQVQRMFDNPAFSKSYVDVAAEAGIKYGLHAMNINRSPYYKEAMYNLYYMQGNSPENKLLIFNGPHYWDDWGWYNYGFSDGALNGQSVKNHLDILMATLETGATARPHANDMTKPSAVSYPYDKYPMQLVPIGDNQPPTEKQIVNANAFNAMMEAGGYAYPKVTSAVPDDFFHAVEQEYGKLIPTETGTEENWWNDGWGTTAYESGVSKLSGSTLALAESAASFASMQENVPYPHEKLDDALERKLTYDEHTWGYHTYDGGAQYQNQWEWKSSNAFGTKALAEDVLSDSLHTLAAPTVTGETGKSIYVYNGLNWVRDDVVTVKDLTDFPTRFEIKDGENSIPYTIENGTLTFLAPAVPAMGYKTFAVVAAETAQVFALDIQSGDNFIENEYYKVTFANDGTIASILDKTNENRELVDQDTADGEKFNQYRYYQDTQDNDNNGRDGRYAPVDVIKIHTPEAAALEIQSDGVRATARTDTSAFRAPTITQTVTLYAGLPRIDIVNEVVKGALPSVWDREEGFYTFPFQTEGTHEIRYDLPVGNVAEGEQVKGTSTDWYTVNKWVGVQDEADEYNMVLATPNTALMQFGERRTGTWSDFDYVSENPYLYSYVFNNMWYTNFQGDQPGYADFRYSISTNTKGADMSANNRFGWETSTPLQAVVMGGAPVAQNTGSYLDISAPNVQLSTLKTAEANGEGMILRVTEVEGKENTNVTITLPYNAKVIETDIIENDTTNVLAESGATFTFAVPAYGYKTFRVVKTGAALGQVTGVTATTAGKPAQTNLIETSTATASTSHSAGYSPDNAKSISDGKEWASSAEKNPWINFAWSAPQTIKTLIIADRPNMTDNIVSAKITFSDNTSITVNDIPKNGAPKTIKLDKAVTTTSIKVEITGENNPQSNVGLAGLEAYAEADVGYSAVKGTAITWNAVENARFYQVFRSTDENFVAGSGNYLGSTDNTILYDAQVVEGLKNTYYYKVRAVGETAAGESSAAAVQTSGTVVDTTAPQTPVMGGVVRDKDRIDLWWTPVGDNLYVDRYELYCNDSKVPQGTTDTYVVNHRHYGRTAGEPYTYTVRAYDASGNYSVSEPLTITIPDDSVAKLTGLTVKQGKTPVAISPAFNAETNNYTVRVDGHLALLAPVTVSATAAQGAKITINGAERTTAEITVNPDAPRIAIKVENEGITKFYTITFVEGESLLAVANVTAGDTWNGAKAIDIINSVGMSGTSSLRDTHDNQANGTTMWYTNANPGANAWVEFDLGQVYPLGEMWIWNMNQAVDRGIKNAKIEYSADKKNWTPLTVPEGMKFEKTTADYPFQFTAATALPNLPATNLNDGKKTPVSFDGKEARYVKITAGSSWGDIHWGLSEVRFTSSALQYNDAVNVSEITVTAADNATGIITSGGTIQMSAAVLPEDATFKEVIWSVVDEDGEAFSAKDAPATISAKGLLRARKDGNIKVKATAMDESGVFALSDVITISGQPVVMTDVTAKAGSEYGGDFPPLASHLVDGSGMTNGGDSVTDTHDNEAKGATMWHTLSTPGANAWVEFDLGAAKNIGEMYIWNMNQIGNGEDNTTRGLKNVKIEYKANADDSWIELRGADAAQDDSIVYPYTFAKASGSPAQAATNLVGGQPVQFNVNAQYVRITADPVLGQGNYGGAGNPYYGLSEVRFTEVPAFEAHDVTIGVFENGAVTANPTSAVNGTKITLSIAPAEGYELGAISVCATDAPNTPVELAGTGNERTFTMPNYGVTVSASFTTAGHDHVIEQIAAKAPNCTTAGNKEYWHCAGCGLYYSDAAGLVPIALEDTVIPATGHEFGENWLNDEINHWHVCTLCNTEKSDEAAHIPDPEAVEGAPIKCTVCEYIIGHEHTPDSVWAHNDTQHWHKCTGCEEKLELADHIWEPKTETTQQCVCGAEKPIPGDSLVESVDILTDSANIYVGSTVQLTATVKPENATNQNVTWASGDETVATVDANGLVTALKNGVATITATTVDGGFTDTCTINVSTYSPPYTPPADDNKTTVKEENPDGSTSTIVTDKKTGTVEETAKYPDGSKVVTTTTKDGAANSVVTVSKVGEKTTVTIPTTEKPAAGMVAVIVKPDGTKEIIKKSIATADGMKITLTEGATIELIDNTKTFADVTGSEWYADAVQFVASRELFDGVAGNAFAPTAPMTRAMLVTVLYRFEGASAKGEGDNWYADSMAWAKEIELSDGTNPDIAITREQLATMLYRYAKEETAQADMSGFDDAGNISDYAKAAMNWAVANNILQGNGNKLNPRHNATRGEVASILQRFAEQ